MYGVLFYKRMLEKMDRCIGSVNSVQCLKHASSRQIVFDNCTKVKLHFFVINVQVLCLVVNGVSF